MKKILFPFIFIIMITAVLIGCEPTSASDPASSSKDSGHTADSQFTMSEDENGIFYLPRI